MQNHLLRFIYPVGGEQFSPDSIVEIKWNNLKVANVNIGFSTNGGASWSSIQKGVSAGFGVYRWKVPNIISTNCKFIVIDQNNSSLSDTSNAAFSVGRINSVENNF